jgi:TolB-like protein
MKPFSLRLMALAASTLVAGAASAQTQVVAPAVVYAPQQQCQTVAGHVVPCFTEGSIPIQHVQSAPGKFAAKIIFLADQLERNMGRKGSNSSFLISSFTNLNNLAETSPLGRLIAENLMHELQVRAWRVYEPRLMQNFVINKNGEFTLSRDVKHLREHYGVTNVVAGTIMNSDDQLVINARVIDTSTGMVMSSGQIQIPSNWFTNGLLEEPRVRNFKIIGG